MVVLVAQSRGGRRFPQVFEVPVQLNRTSFHLKRMLRTSQDQGPDGVCVEGLGTVYTADTFRALASASSVALHLPIGATALPEEALEYARSMTPTSPPAEREPDSTEVLDAVNKIAGMIRDGDTRTALMAAEGIEPLFALRPAREGLSFYAVLGMARRANSDLEGAALCYRVAAMIADASGDESELVGVNYDNLATVRRLQQQWHAAEEASDRALAILERIGGPPSGHLGAALNNRAILLSAEERFSEALDYSERALKILREVLKDAPSSLAPFLEDRRVIEEKSRRR